MNRAATMAIVSARLRAERRAIAYACVAAGLVGAVQPRGLAAPIFFCSLIGITIALLQGPGRRAHLDLCEQSAPLFGRELARAKALAPCIVAALATICYCGAALVAGDHGVLATFVAALGAVLASTLTALCATIRTGSTRTLYVLMAGGVSVVAFGLVAYAGSLAGEAAFAALAALLALRQYGEALARYDPVW